MSVNSGLEIERRTNGSSMNLVVERSSSELHVEDKHFLFRMFFPDVSVDRRRLLAAKTAIRTLKSWFVATLVIHMPIFVSLQGETATALLTLKRLLLVGSVYL